ncbi:unnamed protein product [Prunus brigantina]
MLCKSSFTCNRNLVAAGLCFWSTSTNTMKLRFGMMTPTLLDLAAMAGFRPCGGEVSALSPSKCEVDFGFTKKNKSYKVFMEANAQETGSVTHKEHIAFLMLFSIKMALAQVSLEVQPLTEALAKGHRLALGPMVLAYLYRGNVAKEISFASPTLPKKILLTKQNHSEFIGFETEDQFDSSVNNTIIAEVNEAVVAALADDNQGKHVSHFNVVEIVKDTTQEALPSEAILESLQGMRDYLAAAKATTTSSYNSSLNIAAKATVQTILDKDFADLANEAQHARFMKQLAEGIQAYNQVVMEYNAGQTLTEKIQSTNHILQAHLYIFHEGKEELDKLEEEQKKIEASKSTILAKIDNAVQDSRPY